ncbi:MAG: mycothiol synthase [Pseudonocardiales bacterium]|nr:mycothiol synthase [Pseudonocardiales bacterium]
MPLSTALLPLLDASTRAEVQSLADAIEASDGEPPLSDQALTQLGASEVVHVVADDGDRLVGYAQLDGTSLELAGDATAVAALLDTVEARGDADLLVWSHGKRSPVGGVLASRGYAQLRVLHQLRRNLAEPLPEIAVADGVTVRAFEPGQDEQAWLRVNAAAFATHAEQGRWTPADLGAREAEPWFDPAGFLLAERDGELLGFHWTKIHADGTGEVYVLGIDPSAQGLKLGTALLVRGLAYLASRGCDEVLLYVDDDNGAAMGLYARLGFHSHDADTQWRRNGS